MFIVFHQGSPAVNAGKFIHSQKLETPRDRDLYNAHIIFSGYRLVPNVSPYQWCRKEDNSGGTRLALKMFSALKVQLVVLVSAFVMFSIQFGQFLVCCFSTHGASRAQPFVKVGARAPLPQVGAGGPY